MSKPTAELKCVVTEDTRDDFVALARLNGYRSTSDYLRDLISQHVYGSLSLVSARQPGLGMTRGRQEVGED